MLDTSDYPNAPNGLDRDPSARSGSVQVHVNPIKALIVGAGIGGLTAAIALRRAGIDVTVYERVSELKPVGAGLTLAPNAGLVLRALGLLAAVRARGAVIEDGESRDPQGRRLQQVPIGEIGRELGVPMIALHRAALQETLLAHVGAEVVRLGKECVAFVEHDDGIIVRFADGEEAGGDFLVGADGLHSVVRRQLHGEQPVRYAGYTSWRGVVGDDARQSAGSVSAEIWGCGRRFGYVPLGDGLAYWFATENTAPGTEIHDNAELLDRFGSWSSPVPSLIAATEPSHLIQTDLVDRPPLRNWGRGRVTLLGDAAHPSTPNLGQGACQAIEDALVLADCLRRVETSPAIVPALRDYERLRESRTTTITTQSWRFGRLGQMENPSLCRVRDTLVRLVPNRLALHQLRQIVQPDAAVLQALGVPNKHVG